MRLPRLAAPTVVASVAAPEPRLLFVTPYDKGQAKVIEKAIRESDLGLEPSNMGGVIRVPVLNESHVPERASALAPFSRDLMDDPQEKSWPARLRPMRLFPHPEPVEAIAEVPEGPPITFRWRRTFHRVSRAEGPERIEAEWWIDGEAASPRDYFRIEDQGGRRFWLYREGLYGVGALPPRWFMHGVFA